ncbi:hypothetical protein [Priestia koreensis]|uniref:hypothetical protein n=1 Tax=Priestia koreensis TaxID=284581 RepID=UPI001F581289|nr:hypothetical protein [Priestia koreensis]UNL86686.1 hypothetical protein IE339_09430 [Priestia koreensis]
MSIEEKENVCIRVPKIYDWINRHVHLSIIGFSLCENPPAGDDQYNVAIGDLCELFHYREGIDCFLSDSYGEPISLEELSDMITVRRHSTVAVTLPNGDTVHLEKVSITITGFITLEIEDDCGCVLTSNPIPFTTTQRLLLCAPHGTRIIPVISSFQCDPVVICDHAIQQIQIDIDFCLDVTSEATVRIELEANECAPRNDTKPVSLCKEYIPQCSCLLLHENTN